VEGKEGGGRGKKGKDVRLLFFFLPQPFLLIFLSAVYNNKGLVYKEKKGGGGKEKGLFLAHDLPFTPSSHGPGSTRISTAERSEEKERRGGKKEEKGG